MKNIILILTLNIVFLSSMWNCKNKSDEIRKSNDELFGKMCEKYLQLLQNLSEPKYDDSVKTIIPQKVNSNNIHKSLWALFEITLIDDICKETDMNNNEILLKSMVNEQFLILKRGQCPFYFSLFSEGDIPSNKFYLFVSDIETIYEEGSVPISLFKNCNKIKEIKVICSAFPDFWYDIRYLFKNCENLEKVDLEKLTLNRLRINVLFENCGSLKVVIFQESNGAKEDLNLLYSSIFYCPRDTNKEHEIKVSCTDYFAYLLFSESCMCNKDKSFFIHNNYQKFIKDSGEELKNGNCYRTFTIVLEKGVYI